MWRTLSAFETHRLRVRRLGVGAACAIAVLVSGGAPASATPIVITGTGFEIPAVGAVNYDGPFYLLGGELGFSPCEPQNSCSPGPGTYAVADSSGAGNPTPASGAHDYRMSGLPGSTTQTLDFDEVEVSAFTDVTVSLDLFMSSTDWETDDFFRVDLLLVEPGPLVTEHTVFHSSGDPDTDPNLSEGSWRSYTWNVPAAATSVILRLIEHSDAPDQAERWYIDNVSFKRAVPEPTTALLLTLGLAGLGIRRRLRA